MFEVDVNNVMEQEKKKKDKDHLWFWVLMCKTKNNSEEQFQDEGSYERQNTRDTKFATKKQGFPYWDLHNHSINFSPPAQRGSQTILTISEYGCRTSSHWSVNFNSNIYQCIFFNGYLTFFTCSLAYQGHGFDILLTKNSTGWVTANHCEGKKITFKVFRHGSGCREESPGE